MMTVHEGGGHRGLVASGAVGMVAAIVLCAVSPARGATNGCVGDCDGSWIVEVDELVQIVGAALGRGGVAECVRSDPSGNGVVSVGELTGAVRNALHECVRPPLPPRGCGDGVRTLAEECDDANQENGDGCRQDCILEGNGTIDQAWLGFGLGCGGATARANVKLVAPLGQEFRPERPAVSAVSVRLHASDDPPHDAPRTRHPARISVLTRSVDGYYRSSRGGIRSRSALAGQPGPVRDRVCSVR
jgi:cysteine-rich repeat protein